MQEEEPRGAVRRGVPGLLLGQRGERRLRLPQVRGGRAQRGADAVVLEELRAVRRARGYRVGGDGEPQGERERGRAAEDRRARAVVVSAAVRSADRDDGAERPRAEGAVGEGVRGDGAAHQGHARSAGGEPEEGGLHARLVAHHQAVRNVLLHGTDPRADRAPPHRVPCVHSGIVARLRGRDQPQQCGVSGQGDARGDQVDAVIDACIVICLLHQCVCSSSIIGLLML